MIVFMDQDLNVQVLLGDVNTPGVSIIKQEAVMVKESSSGTVVISDTSGEMSGDTSGDTNGEMYGDITGATTKDPILSSWPFVIGISSITLIVSIVLGILLAKRKIKKGFELYED